MKNRWERYYEKRVRDPETRSRVGKEIERLELGIQIAKLREKQNLNQTQLAAKVGIHASKISKMENAAENVTLHTLSRIARALNRRVQINFVPMVEAVMQKQSKALVFAKKKRREAKITRKRKLNS